MNIYFDLFKLFLKLGFFAYGGPAAHISMISDEVIDKRKWFSEKEFLDLINFTNLIPGPNSTEIAILIGYKKAGVIGLIIAGISFIIPAVLVVILFTALYTKYHKLPYMQSILSGLVPIMFSIILSTVFKLSKKTINTKFNIFVFLTATFLLYLNVNELIVLLCSGLLVLINNTNIKSKIFSLEPFSLTLLFLSFIKIGSILYGSGYVLISYVQNEFVSRLGWLSNNELLDMVAIGEITPGPVFTTATAIGYYLGAIPGALIATAGIFIPSFIMIALLFPLYEKIKKVDWISTILTGVGIASIAMLFNVILNLSETIISNPPSLILTIISVILLYKYKVNNILLIIFGGIFGLFFF